ncbi:alcohol dehydrogenase catalytic domain-containing protein [Sphingomonas sp. C3-2]|nr:alcohol dehydrogenase catalytic domain-containing protein [Sphingomonas sp. C3-2]WOK37508.1 alcohol dehydrogenase catalytic domain-containing protein [Sphingomonas sp. C3-2]
MSLSVRAAVCHGIGKPLSVETVRLRPPGPGEVLVEIKASGLCHSDYHHMTGASTPYPFPVILGHEGAGVVVECGADVESVRVGDHVVPLSIGECGTCGSCRSGRTNLCDEFFAGMATPPARFSLEDGTPVAAYSNNGTFANFIVMPEHNVAKIRPDVPFDIACTIGCAVATGIGAALHTARVEPGASVIVFGLGGIGLNVVQGARLAGATTIIGVDINPACEARALRFGATHFVNPAAIAGDLLDHLRALTGGGADFTFECVGHVGLMETAFAAARVGWGVCTVLGVPGDGEKLPVVPFDLQLGRTLKGSFLGNVRTRSELPGLLDLYAEGRINLDDLVTHRLPIERINEGFDLMARGETLRTVVSF